MQIRIINNSDKAIPQELIDCLSPMSSLDLANNTAEEYNLKIIEVVKDYTDNELTGVTFTVGDSYR